MSGTVIVGGGHAAGQVAASLRQEGYTDPIAVYGDEPHPPYQRPPLSKDYLAGAVGTEKVYLRPEAFYAGKDIALHTGVHVDHIDLGNRSVTTHKGDTHPWDHLVLATGARPRKLAVPGSQLKGVHYLRSLADVDGIRQELNAQTHLVIVGGGYIGLEVAAVAVELGATTTVLEMGKPHPAAGDHRADVRVLPQPAQRPRREYPPEHRRHSLRRRLERPRTRGCVR